MNAKKIIAITAVSLVILAETGVLQVATEKLEVFRKRLQKKYAAKEQELAHSLVKRETKIVFKLSFNVLYFNPLPRKEGDRRGWPLGRHFRYFNPLPRKEGDQQKMSKKPLTRDISIPSLVKRETSGVKSGKFTATGFQSTPS